MDVMLRGVYLTSSLQRGQIDDIFMQSAARRSAGQQPADRLAAGGHVTVFHP